MLDNRMHYILVNFIAVTILTQVYSNQDDLNNIKNDNVEADENGLDNKDRYQIENKPKLITDDDTVPSKGWQPIRDSYADRLKPIKEVNPRYGNNNKYYIQSGGNPYTGSPYIQTTYIPGLYTYPYYAFGEYTSMYRPNAYVYPDYIKKTTKPPYYKS